ncbi:MAG: hypothetical protein L0Y71_08635 [Gemmataceae bacterium]|nr:hypothetical protein [Gemmataceae bacterium]
MTTKELHAFRRRLLEMKNRLGGAVTTLEAEALRPVGGEAAGKLSNVPIHPADLSADAYEEAVAIGMMENEAHLLAEVHDALGRIEAGT